MSTNDSKGASKSGGLADFTKSLDPSSVPLDYVKRFFYQIMGIYFPPVFLFLYFLLLWKENPDLFLIPLNYGDLAALHQHVTSPVENLKSLFGFIGKQNQILEWLLLILGAVILGETINALTAKVTKLSPIKNVGKEGILAYLSLQPWKPWKTRPQRSYFSDPAKVADWPIWLNMTPPVSFAHFDRYYISALEQDKKTLAGKIGWISFYRNMTAILFIVFFLQLYLIYILSIDNSQLIYYYSYEYYVLLIVAALIPMFYYAYRAQVTTHRLMLWDAYRRKELGKNLEIRFGDLSTSLGIIDQFKKKGAEYILDTWFLAVEKSMRDVGSLLVSLAEVKYGEQEDEDKNFNSGLDVFKYVLAKKKLQPRNLASVLSKSSWTKHRHSKSAKRMIVESYIEYNRGNYLQVISNALKILETLDWEITPTGWKIIRGFYIVDNWFRTSEAHRAIEKNVKKWGWTYQNRKGSLQGSSGNSTPDSTQVDGMEKETYEKVAKYVWSSVDPFVRAVNMIEAVLLKTHETDDINGFLNKRLVDIYELFGGYEYEQAFTKAKELYKDQLSGRKSEGPKDRRAVHY